MYFLCIYTQKFSRLGYRYPYLWMDTHGCHAVCYYIECLYSNVPIACKGYCLLYRCTVLQHVHAVPAVPYTAYTHTAQQSCASCVWHEVRMSCLPHSVTICLHAWRLFLASTYPVWPRQTGLRARARVGYVSLKGNQRFLPAEENRVRRVGRRPPPYLPWHP